MNCLWALRLGASSSLRYGRDCGEGLFMSVMSHRLARAALIALLFAASAAAAQVSTLLAGKTAL
jgi:hypothetical protein